MLSKPSPKSSMKAASLRIYLSKCVILGLLPVMVIANFPLSSLAASNNSQKPAKSSRGLYTAQRGAADDYTLGPGDRLRLDIFNVPEYSGEFIVLADGNINLPIFGSVPVQGRTLNSATKLLSGLFARYVKRPIVTLSLLAPRPVQVAIAGEVSRAGSYSIPFTTENRKFPTVSQIIQLAGGTSQTADLRSVKVRRAANGKVYNVNMFDVLQRGNTRQDLSLRDGDTIYIPRAATLNTSDLLRVSASNLANQDTTVKIAIVGEVGKPGTYTLKGETSQSTDNRLGKVSPPTLTEALKLAGGSTPSADLSRIRIRRNTRTGPGQTIPINLLGLLQGGDFSQDAILQDGDTILIPTNPTINSAASSLIAASNIGPQAIAPVKVVVVGEVNRPGNYTLKGEANTTNNNTQLAGSVALPTVTQAIQAASGIKPTANIRQVELRRTTRSGEQVLNLDLFKLLQRGDTSQDVVLQEGDRLYIPYAQTTRPEDVEIIANSTFSPATIKVNVVGELATRVGKSNVSTIEVPPNSTLNQAILVAGGFDNARANKNTVDFIRLNPNGSVTKRTIKLDFAKGIDDNTNPRLQNNDTIVIGRSNLTRIGDGLGSIFNPLAPLLGILNLFR
jgi:polysaccharide export outer membrane protein